MRKLINNIAKAIVNLTSTTGTINATAAQLNSGPRTLTIPANIGTRKTAHRQPDELLTNGKFTPDHLELLNSNYLRDAIAGLGAWSSLALMFSAYDKQVSNRRTEKDWSKYEFYRECFHVWNSATSVDKQMDADKVIIALDKIAEVPVAKGNKDTDAIIARHLNKSVEEVQADRIKRAETQTKARKEMLSAIAAEIWAFSGEEVEDCYLSSTKVLAKATQTMEWIANTWQGEPAAIASELLLIEADAKIIKELAQKEANHEKEGADEITENHSKPKYQTDPAKETSDAGKLDKAAYDEWLSNQHE